MFVCFPIQKKDETNWKENIQKTRLCHGWQCFVFRNFCRAFWKGCSNVGEWMGRLFEEKWHTETHVSSEKEKLGRRCRLVTCRLTHTQNIEQIENRRRLPNRTTSKANLNGERKKTRHCTVRLAKTNTLWENGLPLRVEWSMSERANERTHTLQYARENVTILEIQWNQLEVERTDWHG